jgi:hypothetical protein
MFGFGKKKNKWDTEDVGVIGSAMGLPFDGKTMYFMDKVKMVNSESLYSIWDLPNLKRYLLSTGISTNNLRGIPRTFQVYDDNPTDFCVVDLLLFKGEEVLSSVNIFDIGVTLYVDKKYAASLGWWQILGLDTKDNALAMDIIDCLQMYKMEEVSWEIAESMLRNIGQKINDHNRQVRIAEAAVKTAREEFGVNVSIRLIEAAWDGIGGWRR